MQIERFLPSAKLTPVVKAFIKVESPEGMENRILPDTSLVLAFRLKGKVHHLHNGTPEHLPPSVLSGLRSSSRLVGYAAHSTMLLVIFREGGAAAFFAEPLHHFFAASLSLQEITGTAATEVEEQLAEAATTQEAIAVVERFLCACMKENAPDKLVHEAIRRIRDANGNLRIKDLAASLNISLDPFEKRFRQEIGSSPKQFAETIRLRHFIETHTDTATLTEAAHAAGYFDQSHFIRRFRNFAGQTPTQFFENPPHW